MLMADPQWEVTSGSGRIEDRWIEAVELPAARPFSRGYDRIAVDGLLEECADVIDELTVRLRDARDEADLLRRQALAGAGRRARPRGRGRRPAPTRHHGRRSVPVR